MRTASGRSRRGFTLMELMTAVGIAMVPTFAVAIMLVGSQQQWTRMFNSAVAGVHQDATNTIITFGSIGRKSNKSAYTLYKRTNNTFAKANPTGAAEQVVEGDAVEFVFWDEDVNSDLMDFNVKGTAYAFLYVDNTQLKADYGPYPPGAVDGSGNRRTGDGINTQVLAKNVSSLKFSHTTIKSAGMGSVRINMVLTEPGTGKTVTVKTSTLIRNTWPR